LLQEPLPQDHEDPERWPLDVDNQDYTDLPDDLYASEVYKQRLATEKITFAGTADVNRPVPTLPEYLQDFADVFSKDKAFELWPHREGVDHAINLEPDTTPPNRPVFRQSEAEIKALKEYLEEFQKCGFIRKSTSPRASPTLYVPKPGTKDLRLCVDYRGLNAITIKNRYPLPLIDSLLDEARKAPSSTQSWTSAMFTISSASRKGTSGSPHLKPSLACLSTWSCTRISCT